MSTEGIISALICLAIVGLWVGRPFLGRRRRGPAADTLLETQRERVVVYYERVLRNLRDLEEDHITGKISPEDYEQERDLWLQRGAQALQTLDQLDGSKPLNGAGRHLADIDAAIDREIEAAVAQYRRQSS